MEQDPPPKDIFYQFALFFFYDYKDIFAVFLYLNAKCPPKQSANLFIQFTASRSQLTFMLFTYLSYLLIYYCYLTFVCQDICFIYSWPDL